MLRPRYNPRPLKLPSDQADLAACVAHYKALLSPAADRGHPDADMKLQCAPRTPVSDDVPTEAEVILALKALRDTAPGPDKIRASALKRTPSEVVALIQAAWRDGAVPPAFGDAVLVSIPRRRPHARGTTIEASRCCACRRRC